MIKKCIFSLHLSFSGCSLSRKIFSPCFLCLLFICCLVTGKSVMPSRNPLHCLVCSTWNGMGGRGMARETEGWREGTALWGGAKGREESSPLPSDLFMCNDFTFILNNMWPMQMNCFYYLVQYSTKRRKERGGEKKKTSVLLFLFLFFGILYPNVMFTPPLPTGHNLLHKYRLLNKTIDHWMYSSVFTGLLNVYI